MKKLTILLLTLLFCLSASVCTAAAGDAPRLVDDADILRDAEESALIAKLDEISERQMVDVVLHTVSTIGDASIMDSADNLFEVLNYGMNTDRSCILLLVSMEEREWHITTAGFGITAVTDVGLTYLSEQFTPGLSAGDYAAAFTAYADTCDDLLTRARAGNPFDADDLPKEPFPAVRNFLICLAIGFIAAWIMVGKQKAQLYSVRQKLAAKDYVKSGSLAVDEAKDLFLYKTVNRREKSTDSDNSGTHKTSSGTTVGGGGGKF